MSKVTAKYQITIPPSVRKELGIIPGSEVEINKKGGEYVLVVKYIDQLKLKWRGKFKDGQKTDAYMDDIRGKVE